VSTTAWDNRIVGYRLIPIDEITANPRNWRVHPKHQQDALAAAIDESGYTVPILNNVRTGFLLDGHLRVALAMRRGETHVPGVDVDLDEDQEAIALATIDPLSALAVPDRVQLDALLADIATESAALQAMLDSLVDGAQRVGNVPVAPELIATQHACPECGHVFQDVV
jgi:ParB-like chromosome segregation protein Spo0J